MWKGPSKHHGEMELVSAPNPKQKLKTASLQKKNENTFCAYFQSCAFMT